MNPLWDRPVRLIHWAIVLIIPASWWTAEEGYLDAHQWLGLSLLTLVLTRLAWGFVGSPQARFADFLRGPGSVVAYLKGAESQTPGHNPIGGWSAILLWGMLIAQVLTGSVSSDGILFDGPFRYVLDTRLADSLAEIHEQLFWVLLGLIALHVSAIVFYEKRRNLRLLRPMLKGQTPDRYGTGPVQSSYKAILIAIVIAGLIWLALATAPAPPASYW